MGKVIVEVHAESLGTVSALLGQGMRIVGSGESTQRGAVALVIEGDFPSDCTHAIVSCRRDASGVRTEFVPCPVPDAATPDEPTRDGTATTMEDGTVRLDVLRRKPFVIRDIETGYEVRIPAAPAPITGTIVVHENGQSPALGVRKVGDDVAAGEPSLLRRTVLGSHALRRKRAEIDGPREFEDETAAATYTCQLLVEARAVLDAAG